MDRALGVPVAGQVAARELVRAPKGGSGLINSWERWGNVALEYHPREPTSPTHKVLGYKEANDIQSPATSTHPGDSSPHNMVAATISASLRTRPVPLAVQQFETLALRGQARDGQASFEHNGRNRDLGDDALAPGCTGCHAAVRRAWRIRRPA
jgi:hypothetical protein